MFAKIAEEKIAITDIRRRSLLAVACILLLPCAAFTQTPQPPASPNAITMQQAVDIARMKNPSLLSSQQNLLSVSKHRRFRPVSVPILTSRAVAPTSP